nr:hypothetical protein [Tanacetum cinerariifolium]
MPPRKRLCLSTLGSRYEVRESSTARPTKGRGIDYRDTWVYPTETVPEIAPMTVGEVNTTVTELVEHHEHDTQDLYALLKDVRIVRLAYPNESLKSILMVETLRVMGDMRREMGDMQAELLALHEQPRRAGQPRRDARVPNHQDAPRDADSHV